jgi:hypothetical protein
VVGIALGSRKLLPNCGGAWSRRDLNLNRSIGGTGRASMPTAPLSTSLPALMPVTHETCQPGEPS